MTTFVETTDGKKFIEVKKSMDNSMVVYILDGTPMMCEADRVEIFKSDKGPVEYRPTKAPVYPLLVKQIGHPSVTKRDIEPVIFARLSAVLNDDVSLYLAQYVNYPPPKHYRAYAVISSDGCRAAYIKMEIP